MKHLIVFSLSFFLVYDGLAQLKVKAKCQEVEVDILDGKVNSLKADAPGHRVRETLPCFTSAAEESDSAKCGGHVFYKDKDLYFYTDRDYIEIGPKFNGKLTLPLMGAQRKNLFQYLGNPRMKDDSWEAYQTAYGTLVLHFDAAGKVRLMQLSTHSTATLSLCE